MLNAQIFRSVTSRQNLSSTLQKHNKRFVKMTEETQVVEQPNITEEDAKKALKEGNPSLAVEYYSSKLQSIVQQYGDVAPECADTYLAYGKALLSQARIEFDILGTGINKTIEDQNKEPEPEPEPPANTNGKKIFFNDDKVVEEKESDDEDDEEGQDPTNPQDTVENAWEILEVARVIYTKLDNKLALSEVYLTLGDLSMESDNMEQAVTEYSECLALRQQVLSTEDTRLAEVHYQIALANTFLNKNKEALTHFVMSKKIFEAKLAKLQATPEDIEIKDVKEIIAELQEKIDEFTAPMPALKAEAKEPKSQSGFSKPTMSNSTPINTLTARVKPAPPANTTPATEAPTEAKTVVKRKIEDV